MATNTLDFLKQFKDNVRSLSLNTVTLVQNINTDKDSIAVIALPGSTVIRSYYDGVEDKGMNYEIRGKTKKPEDVEIDLNVIAEHISNLTALPSQNNSYEFIDIKVSDEPYFLEADDDGYFFFSLGFTANLTIY